MRFVDIREETHPIASDIRNAYIDFSAMTCSLVAPHSWRRPSIFDIELGRTSK